MRPRAVTYNATCHEWFSQGICTSRILPTICVHKCSVSHVSFHAANGNSGHSSISDCDMISPQGTGVGRSAP